MNSRPSPKSINSNDVEYIKWKKWDDNIFGKLNFQEKRYFDAELKELIRRRKNLASILEIGFGNGKFLRYCADSGWAVTGVEINPALVKVAKKNGFNALNSSDLSELSSNQFDLVAAFDVLEHIPQNQILTLLLEISRVLRTEGICLLRFPNGDSPFGLSNQNGDITHVSTIGFEKIQYFANQTSLKLISCRGECEPLLEKTIIQTVRRATSLSFKKIINAFILLIFYKKRNYCSDNLVAILEKTANSENT